LIGTQDFFLTKFNSSGEKLYTKQMGATGKVTSAYSVATDGAGNVYVTGYTDGGLDGNTLTGVLDFFLAKFSSTGEKLYTKQMGIQGKYAAGYGLATDVNGNVYVTGSTNGDLDGNILLGNQDVFLTKFSSLGNKLYTKQLGVSVVLNAESSKVVSAEGVSVKTDASGNVYVLGNLYNSGRDTPDGLDGNPMTGKQDFFFTKFNNSGEKQFTKQMGVKGVETHGKSVTVDPSGNVYVAGYSFGGLDGNTLIGNNDLFLVKFNGVGDKQFTRQLVGVQDKQSQAWGVASDANGNIFAAGDTNGLAGETLTGTNDFLLIKFNSSGVKQ
jgi:hypothetical protein